MLRSGRGAGAGWGVVWGGWGCPRDRARPSPWRYQRLRGPTGALHLLLAIRRCSARRRAEGPKLLKAPGLHRVPVPDRHRELGIAATSPVKYFIRYWQPLLDASLLPASLSRRPWWSGCGRLTSTVRGLLHGFCMTRIDFRRRSVIGVTA